MPATASILAALPPVPPRTSQRTAEFPAESNGRFQKSLDEATKPAASEPERKAATPSRKSEGRSTPSAQTSKRSAKKSSSETSDAAADGPDDVESAKAKPNDAPVEAVENGEIESAAQDDDGTEVDREMPAEAKSSPPTAAEMGVVVTPTPVATPTDDATVDDAETTSVVDVVSPEFASASAQGETPVATASDESAAAGETDIETEVPGQARSARPAAAHVTSKHAGVAESDAPETESAATLEPAPATEVAKDKSADVARSVDDLAERVESVQSENSSSDAPRPEPAASSPSSSFEAAMSSASSSGARQVSKPDQPTPPPPAPPTPEARFAADNHERIVSDARAQLLPNGGTMKLRLDPPELGSMQVSLHIRDGVVTAAFQTSNDEAARLLSHTLSDLRSTLESHGIVVDKLHVQQAPKEQSGGGATRDGANRDGQQSAADNQHDARRDQQRKDMVQRLWDKLAGKGPLDLVA